jgi:hypothetical protein
VNQIHRPGFPPNVESRCSINLSGSEHLKTICLVIVDPQTQRKHYYTVEMMESTSQANRKTHKKPGILPDA